MKLANVARGTSKFVIIVAFVHDSGRVTGKQEVIWRCRLFLFHACRLSIHRV
jgi:hypothetical protein